MTCLQYGPASDNTRGAICEDYGRWLAVIAARRGGPRNPAAMTKAVMERVVACTNLKREAFAGRNKAMIMRQAKPVNKKRGLWSDRDNMCSQTPCCHYRLQHGACIHFARRGVRGTTRSSAPAWRLRNGRRVTIQRLQYGEHRKAHGLEVACKQHCRGGECTLQHGPRPPA